MVDKILLKDNMLFWKTADFILDFKLDFHQYSLV